MSLVPLKYECIHLRSESKNLWNTQTGVLFPVTKHILHFVLWRQRSTISSSHNVGCSALEAVWELFSCRCCTCPTLAVVTLVNVSNNKTPNATDSGVLGGWWFGASPSSPDSNFLRVHNAFPNRRLSDNALMMPPKIRIAPSCASSPGGTPGGGGLPIRRHSSIGPQERRGSTVNLSPPTVSTIILYVLGWELLLQLYLLPVMHSVGQTHVSKHVLKST
jgi:hypothetical protein